MKINSLKHDLLKEEERYEDVMFNNDDLRKKLQKLEHD